MRMVTGISRANLDVSAELTAMQDGFPPLACEDACTLVHALQIQRLITWSAAPLGRDQRPQRFSLVGATLLNVFPESTAGGEAAACLLTDSQ
jgi:hypothetical protein